MGHDTLSAEKKGSNEQLQFKGDFNVAITCNSKLRIRLEGDADAWQRRLLVVSYDRPRTAKPIAEFANKLIAEEGAGIIKWMVAGAQIYLDDMNNHGTMQLTDGQHRRVDMLLAESDSIRKFVETGVVAEQGATVTSKQLSEGYFDYCHRMEWEGYAPDEVQRKIVDLMREIHNARQSHDIRHLAGNCRGYRNLALVRNE